MSQSTAAAQGAPSASPAAEAPLFTPEPSQQNPATPSASVAPAHTVASNLSVSVKQEQFDPFPAMAPPRSHAESASLKTESRLGRLPSETEASTVRLPNPPDAVSQMDTLQTGKFPWQTHAMPSLSTVTSRTAGFQQPHTG